jgi:hypothetical protein
MHLPRFDVGRLLFRLPFTTLINIALAFALVVVICFASIGFTRVLISEKFRLSVVIFMSNAFTLVLFEIYIRCVVPMTRKFIYPSSRMIPKVGYRIDGNAYAGVDEGHRTTFIVGLADMLSFSKLYFDRKYNKRVDAMLQYQAMYKSADLRKWFDEYMKRDGLLDKQAASCYFQALYDWSAKS